MGVELTDVSFEFFPWQMAYFDCIYRGIVDDDDDDDGSSSSGSSGCH